MNKTWIQVNDPHLASQAPRGRTPTFEADILAKLAWVMEYANGVAAEGIVITGDLLNRKNPTHTSHLLVQKIRAVFALAKAPVHLIVGNHDRNNGGQLDGQPILGVVDGTHVHLLDGPSGHDSYIAGIPWSDSFEGDGGADQIAELMLDARRPMIFGHLPVTNRAFPFGGEAHGWVFDADVIAALHMRGLERRPPHTRPRLLAHGHFHWQQPISVLSVEGLSDGITFSNPGALARATVAADDIERAPSIAVVEFNTDTLAVRVEYVPIPCRPAVEVLRLEEHARDTEREDAVQALARSLVRAYSEVVDADTLRDMLMALGCPEQFSQEVWERGVALAAAAIDGEVALT